MTTPAPTWRLTCPPWELNITCDLCGATATTVHWWPWTAGVTTAKGSKTQVLFACATHDPGGYWLDLKKYWTNLKKGGDFTTERHVYDKDDGASLALFYDRLDALRTIPATPQSAPGNWDFLTELELGDPA